MSVLSLEQRRHLEILLYLRDVDRHLPHPALLQDRRTQDDAFQSFFRERPAGLFDTAKGVGWETVDQAKSYARTTFMTEAPDTHAWLSAHITGLLRDLTAQEIHDAIERLDIAGGFACPSNESGVILRLAAEMVVRGQVPHWPTSILPD